MGEKPCTNLWVSAAPTGSRAKEYQKLLVTCLHHLRNHTFQYRLVSFCTMYCVVSSLEEWAGSHHHLCVSKPESAVLTELVLLGSPTWLLSQLGRNGYHPHTGSLCKPLWYFLWYPEIPWECNVSLLSKAEGPMRFLCRSVKLCKQPKSPIQWKQVEQWTSAPENLAMSGENLGWHYLHVSRGEDAGIYPENDGDVVKCLMWS